MNRKMVVAGALGGVLALTLTACGGSASPAQELVDGDWDEVVAAAEEEGRLVFYNGGTVQQGERLVEAFNEAYPDIDVVSERGGAEMVARVEAEMANDIEGADTYLVADDEFFQSHEDEFLPVQGPGSEGLNEDAWVVDDKVAGVNGSPYSMFVWNTNIFPDGFDDYEEFLSEDVEGKVAFRGDASRSAAGYLDFLETNFGTEYLEDLGKTNLLLYPSVVPATEAVASGEAGATLGALPPHVFDLIESGAPLEYKYPDPGYAIGFSIGALENARQPNAAVVFADFAMSAEGQQALNGDEYGIATRPDVSGSIEPEGWDLLVASDFPADLIAEWNERIAEYFR